MLASSLLLLWSARDPGLISIALTFWALGVSRGRPWTPRPQQCLFSLCLRFRNTFKHALHLPTYGQFLISLSGPLCLPRQKGQVSTRVSLRWCRNPVPSLTRTVGGGHKIIWVGSPSSLIVVVPWSVQYSTLRKGLIFPENTGHIPLSGRGSKRAHPPPPHGLFVSLGAKVGRSSLLGTKIQVFSTTIWICDGDFGRLEPQVSAEDWL